MSVQVLQEFHVQTTRATRADRLSHHQAARLVESFLRFPVQALTVGVMLQAFATRDRFGISYWDAAILELPDDSGVRRSSRRTSATPRTTTALP